MDTTDAGGVQIAYHRQGSGPPVVLVHGLGGTSRAIWKHLGPELAREFEVVAYDLRGAGESARPQGRYSLDDFVFDLGRLIEQLELERPALVGHSFGGSVVLKYAADYPRDVAAVVAVGGPTTLPEQTRQAMRDRAATVEAEGMGTVAETVATNGMAPSFRAADPAAFREYVELLAANDVAAYAATCRTIGDLDLEDDLGRIEAPVLLLGGDQDGVAPPAAQERTAAAIADAEVVLVPETGHILPWEQPQRLREEVLRFLRSRMPVAT